MINKKGTIAISQIGVLIISILAIAFLIGAATPMVKADEVNVPCAGTCKATCGDGEVKVSSVKANVDGKLTTSAYCLGTNVCCVKSSSGDDESGGDGGSGWDQIAINTVISTLAGLGTTWVWTKYGPRPISSGLKKVTEEVAKEMVKEGATKGASWFGGSAAFAVIAAAAAAFGTAILIDQAMALVGASERNDRGVSTTAYITATTVTTTAIILGITGNLAGGSLAVGAAGMFGFSVIGTGGLALIAAAIVLLAAATYAGFTWQDYSQEIFVYEVHQWQPVDKGEDCEQCNSLEYGCSEYQCRSYGKGCALINEGTSDQMCYWKNSREFNPLQISPLDSALISLDYSYESLSNVPPERGTQITYQGGCVPAFTSIVLGVETNEPAQCKIDLERKEDYDPMLSFMEQGVSYVYNHTLTLPSSLTPTRYAAEQANLSIQNGGIYDYYIRCKDGNGIFSRYNFQMNFCVDDGPDMNEPIIIKSNYPRVGDVDVGYIRFNESIAPLNVYTNEPATCKWDYQDLAYSQMKNNFTECSQSLEDYMFPSTLEYGCKGEVQGIKSRETNDFYVRCQDKPLWTENDEGRQIANKRSYPIYLLGTEPMIIDSVTVNGKQNGSILKDSKSIVDIFLEVKTLGGAEEGQARCEYKFENNPYVPFYNNGSVEYLTTNFQEMNLVEGKYVLPIKCYDLAKNLAYYDLHFTIDVDLESPMLARAYYEEGFLKLITTEQAECVYSTVSCTYEFKDGSKIDSSSDALDHFVRWDTTTDMYVKCKDIYGNQPSIGQCNIVVRAHEGG